jgi:transcriptional regulator with XRE-family HTH domain
LADIYSRIRDAREYRRLSQAECAAWLNIGQSLYGKKEKGTAGGLDSRQLQMLLGKMEIDARSLVGQLDGPIEQADLRLYPPEKALTERLLEEIQELRKRTRPLKELDPLAERVVSDLELRRLVEKLVRRRAHFKRIEGYLEGLEERLSESHEGPEPKKENAAGG